LDWYSRYQELATSEKEQFRVILNRLVSGSFIVKGQEQGRKDFYFIDRHQDIFEGYLSVLGWELIVDRPYGICQLVSKGSHHGESLSMIESILLLIIRLLYEEQRKELSLTQDVVITTEDIQTKYLALKIRSRLLEKQVLKSCISLFRRHNLVEPLDTDVTDPRCRIRVLHSILFAVQADSLAALHARLSQYEVGQEGVEEGDEPTE